MELGVKVAAAAWAMGLLGIVLWVAATALGDHPDGGFLGISSGVFCLALLEAPKYDNSEAGTVYVSDDASRLPEGDLLDRLLGRVPLYTWESLDAWVGLQWDDDGCLLLDGYAGPPPHSDSGPCLCGCTAGTEAARELAILTAIQEENQKKREQMEKRAVARQRGCASAPPVENSRESEPEYLDVAPHRGQLVNGEPPKVKCEHCFGNGRFAGGPGPVTAKLDCPICHGKGWRWETGWEYVLHSSGAKIWYDTGDDHR